MQVTERARKPVGTLFHRTLIDGGYWQFLVIRFGRGP